MEIDLSKTLLAKYSIQGKFYYIEYESIHLICFHCGKYGHTIEYCPKKPLESMPLVLESNVQDDAKRGAMVAPKNDFLYGNWMITQKSKCLRRKQGSDGENFGN